MRNSAAASLLARLLLVGGAASLVPLPFAGGVPALASARPWTALVVLIGAALWAKRRYTNDDLATATVPWWSGGAFVALTAAAFVAATLRFWQAFDVNAIDFSLFDWMLYNTSHGRFMWAPFVELPHFSVHRFYLALPLVPLHAWLQTPYFLLLLHPAILVLGAWPLFRLARRLLPGTALAWLVVACYLLNGWTTSILNYSFHLEALYLPLGFALLDAWTGYQSVRFWLYAGLLLLVKEDFALTLIAFGAGICLCERRRWRTGAALALLSAAYFAVDMWVARPYFSQGYSTQPTFLTHWAAYGATFGAIAWRMLLSPGAVLWNVLTSQWYVLFGAALLLPLTAPLALIAMLPNLLILGSATNPTLRSFGLYYAAPLLPFFFWSLLLAYRRFPRLFVAALAGVCFAKGSTLHYVPARSELADELDAVVRTLDFGKGPVCAQASIFPHLPYRPEVQALTPACLAQPGGRALINLQLSAYPYAPEVVQAMVAGRPVATATPHGFEVR